MEKRYPYKIPMKALFSLLVVLGAVVSGGCFLFGWLQALPITPGIALMVGISVAVSFLVFVLIMRMLRPPYLIIREDGITFPGRPKEGWWVAFTDIEEVRVDPPFLGYRSLALKAQPKPWSRAKIERWWSVSERMLPTKEAFDEICSHILTHVERVSPEQELDHPMR